jgi:hypothetical protein
VAGLTIVPVTFRQACAFIEKHHRHHKPPRGMKFCIGVQLDLELAGVATAGRPVARAFDDGLTLEINRTCTDGAKNANSMLYGACWRAAKAMGYMRALTYIQDGETGISLKAAGWVLIRAIEARGSWAEASVKLRNIRDPDGPGGVRRELWGIWREGAVPFTAQSEAAERTFLDILNG